MYHIGANADRGDYASKCDHCQFPYLRSEVVRGSDGLLACEECRCREPPELDEANAAGAKEVLLPGPNDGGRYESVDTTGAVSLETLLATLGTP